MAVSGKKVLIITADDFEDTELLAPMYRLKEEGAQVDVAAPSKGSVKGKHGYEVEANLGVKDISLDGLGGYDLLFLPGGKAPSKLRGIKEVQEIAKRFDANGKPIAAICHGPQILISAGLMQGKTATAYSEVQPELKEAGATVKDQEVVVEGNYVFSRNPNDIPAFNRELVKKLGQ